ncbi:RelA/SpoT domain-containing protein [Serratia marcescens]|uniref:RelA/SpoT domain-containing protein n=1 Tax=Serratia marcescens TaxID=615 RepID=UPI0013DB2CF3|nr:RelA/SpoT domain-containing protein [Serratia marcescens]
MKELCVSKKEVGRAGERVVASYVQKIKYNEQDVKILHDWRMLHLYPLNKVKYYLNREAVRVNKNALVSSRIKRLPSIVAKLSRFPDMRLHKMQDLGGCRAIVDNLNQVYELVNNIKRLRTKHEICREDNYMVNVKDSGYRSYHIVYSFVNDKYMFLNGLRVEVQIRTAMQHSWATAVEMVGLFRKEQLKSSFGDIEWLHFFKLVSELFYNIESGKTTGSYIRTSEELKVLSEKLRVFDMLSAYNKAVHIIDGSEKYKDGLCVILVDTNSKEIKISGFDSSSHSKASKFYFEQEKYCSDNEGCEVAMVSVSSIGDLKNAYPAYLLDTRTFLNNLGRFVF